jgi:hypothetical protein
MRQRTYLMAVLMLVCAAHVVAQETLPTTGQSLEGTWIAQVAPP